MMPPNPLKALTDYLHGEDLKTPATTAPVVQQKALTVSGFPDYREVQHLLVHGPGASETEQWRNDGNSAVFPCLMAVSAAYIEPPIKVWQKDADGTREWLSTHPMQQLLDEPHPELTALELAFWTSWARHCDGNAYLRKFRAGNDLTGNVVMLHPLSPALVTPMTRTESDNFIDFYRYTYAPGKFEDIEPQNIIHFRLGIDDRDTRLGLSPLKRLVRDIATDDEASRFSEALLKNFAIPGLVVELPADSAPMSRDDAEDLADRISSRFGGDGRGKVGVLAGGAKVAPVGFSPEQIQLKALHDVPESRIAACIGVPPAIAGLTIGLEQTANYASMRQLRENFTEIKLVPLWTMDDATINKHLKPDFESARDIIVARDLTDVRALQEDENEKYKRLTDAVTAGWLTPDEARSETGYGPMADVMPTLPAGTSLPPGQVPPALPAAAMRQLVLMKQRGDFSNYPELMAAMVGLAMPGFESELETHFDAQRLRTKRKILGGG
jgi:HK97 family phage portal protein